MKKAITLLGILLMLAITATPEATISKEKPTEQELVNLNKNLDIVSKACEDSVYRNKYANTPVLSRLNYLRTSELTFENFVEYLDLINVKNRDILVRKAIIESGWFKSYLTVNYNNIFGMCTPKSRPTTALGEAFKRTVSYDSTDNRGAATIHYSYAKFAHWTDSVDDLLLWTAYWEGRGFDTSNYYAFLHKLGYSYESGYIKTLRSLNILKYYPNYA